MTLHFKKIIHKKTLKYHNLNIALVLPSSVVSHRNEIIWISHGPVFTDMVASYTTK